ncbi:hypothetical protein DFP73DRAFT_550194 [Morchella snyderi]|nr:hypothetical protein DFP73DRAFT_550194 [Morchella snyderi]
MYGCSLLLLIYVRAVFNAAACVLYGSSTTPIVGQCNSRTRGCSGNNEKERKFWWPLQTEIRVQMSGTRPQGACESS